MVEVIKVERLREDVDMLRAEKNDLQKEILGMKEEIRILREEINELKKTVDGVLECEIV